MRGYWKNPQETQACITQDGFFKTGDVAVVGNDGRLRIVDRKKDLIIVSGFNVYPNEIEAEIANLDGVLESACIGYPSPKTGEGVALYIVKYDPDLSVDDVITHCKASLAKYKIPSKIEFLDELPKSTVGKILRRELRTILNK